MTIQEAADELFGYNGPNAQMLWAAKAIRTNPRITELGYEEFEDREGKWQLWRAAFATHPGDVFVWSNLVVPSPSVGDGKPGSPGVIKFQGKSN